MYKALRQYEKQTQTKLMHQDRLSEHLFTLYYVTKVPEFSTSWQSGLPD